MVSSLMEQRFWAKVDKSSDLNGCWLWTASKLPSGYGQIRQPRQDGGKLLLAHRVSLEIAGRSAPPPLVVDHLCRVTSCVNPAHLDVVTNQENLKRGSRKGWMEGRCSRGHDITDPKNLLPNGVGGKRTCRPCRDVRTVGRERVR